MGKVFSGVGVYLEYVVDVFFFDEEFELVGFFAEANEAWRDAELLLDGNCDTSFT